MKRVIRASKSTVDYDQLSSSIHDYIENGTYRGRLEIIRDVSPESGYKPFIVVQVYSEDHKPVGYIKYEGGKFSYQIYNANTKASKLDTLESALYRFESAMEVFRDIENYL